MKATKKVKKLADLTFNTASGSARTIKRAIFRKQFPGEGELSRGLTRNYSWKHTRQLPDGDFGYFGKRKVRRKKYGGSP